MRTQTMLTLNCLATWHLKNANLGQTFSSSLLRKTGIFSYIGYQTESRSVNLLKIIFGTSTI